MIVAKFGAISCLGAISARSGTIQHYLESTYVRYGAWTIMYNTNSNNTKMRHEPTTDERIAAARQIQVLHHLKYIGSYGTCHLLQKLILFDIILCEIRPNPRLHTTEKRPLAALSGGGGGRGEAIADTRRILFF